MPALCPWRRQASSTRLGFLDQWVWKAQRHGEVGTYVNEPETQVLHRWLGEQYPVLEELARREGGSSMVSGLRELLPSDRWRDSVRIALEIKGRIDKRDVLEQVKAGGGPILSASQLHPDVWAAARKAWEAGLHRQAVGDAATAVESMAKIKVGGAGVSGAKLFGSLFSTYDPKPGEPRLRFPDVDRGQADRWESAHGGARDFGQGCMRRGSGTGRLTRSTRLTSRWRWSTWRPCPCWRDGSRRPRLSTPP